jgi:hypothetical protein
MRWLCAWRTWCMAAALAACGADLAVAEDTGDAMAIEAANHPATSMQALDALASAQPSFDPLIGGTQAGQFLFYTGVDAWRYGATGYGGIQWAPGSLDKEGFILRLIASEGLERYDAASKRTTTEIFRAALMPGWKFKRGSFEVQVFAGPDLEIDIPRYGSPITRMSGTHFGARGGADFWWEPIPQMMLASSFSATTIANSYSARGTAGWRIADLFWLGPEISMSADDYSQQYRVGMHITGFKFAGLDWSAAAGYVQDSFHRSGVYGRLGVSLRR